MKRKIIIFLILILGILGCKSIDITNSKKKLALEETRIRALVMNELEGRYDEKFEIRRIRYDKRRDKWKLEVYPLENNIDDETFVAYVKKDPKERVIENYPSIKEANLTTIYYRPIIKKIFKEKKLYFWGNMGIHIYDEKRDSLKILKRKKFDFFFNNISNKMHVNIQILIFEDVTSTEAKKEAFIKEVWELFKYLKSQNLEWASIRIKIYDKEFFRDKDIDHILKVSNWFSRGISEFDVFKYRRKQKYSIWVEEKEYYQIKSLDDMKKQFTVMKKYYQK
ncbi:hypothetical protein [Haliovirga abyssi]|uniref:Lipoprotein n=1 Tax=Haliovirga abyssi TaxID=2996794 RepID=A0AAU9DWH5_9FUSO|nr:hypothetical protein [Haliovirga abyssi]BDU50626.1 hypothetical protein HLVA_11950 [Haliovirga abyssi]